jgi:hypothetical protein
MQTLAQGLSYVDLEFLGTPRVIATVVLHNRSGVALIDPGPSSNPRSFNGVRVSAGVVFPLNKLASECPVDKTGRTC